MKRSIPFVSILLFCGLAACQQVKSENPLSPNIAGPMAGVEITAPRLLEPEPGRTFKPDEQPLTLLIENSSSNSPRPFYYNIEISADEGFTALVFTQNNVKPGDAGRTSLVLPGNLQVGRTYHWRVQAADGANTSALSAPSQFEVLEPVVIGAPEPLSPVGNVLLPNRRPTFSALNAPKSGPYGPIRYLFEVALDQAFVSRVVLEEIPEGGSGGDTDLVSPHDLGANLTHYWRVRAFDPEVQGPWSDVATFRTPAASGGGGGGGGGGTPGKPCGPPYPTTGEGVIACVASQYPERLAAGVSLHEREENMVFIRDRVIETGICGGLDLAWNKKRGDGPHSIDALAWRLPNGFVEVVDIGVAYDDPSQTLQLAWNIVDGPPGYDPYFPAPNCSGTQ